jgi:hypothetical protein
MKKNLIFVFFLLAVLNFSCKKIQEETPPTETKKRNNKSMSISTSQGGVQLQNPYKTSLMASAYTQVKQNNPNFPDLYVRTTHLYVKVTPADSLQIEALSCDSLIELYNYPLDRSFKPEDDPEVMFEPTEAELKMGIMHSQYACIPVGYNFPQNIPYEILDELYVPELDPRINDENGIMDMYDEVTDSLEVRAFNMTGNDIEEEQTENMTQGRGVTMERRHRKFNPKGRATRIDDEFNTATTQIPIHGVKVRARRWFNTKSTFTDANGNYQITYRFRRPVNYSIDWSQRDFQMRNTNLFLRPARYKGPKRRGDWNVHFSRQVNERQLHFSVIFQAAHDYYYNKQVDIRTPPTRHLYRKLQISAMKRTQSASGHAGDYSSFLGNAIRIFNPGQLTQFTYGVTIHELAHASHWRMNNIPFYCIRKVVKESWARAVETIFTSQRYRNYGLAGYVYRFEFQGTPSNDPNVIAGYTQIGIDLADERNQRFIRPNRNPADDHLFADDNVTGFTLRQVEDALVNARTLEHWRDALLNMNTGVRGADINNLFNFYITLGINSCPACHFCTF